MIEPLKDTFDSLDLSVERGGATPDRVFQQRTYMQWVSQKYAFGAYLAAPKQVLLRTSQMYGAVMADGTGRAAWEKWRKEAFKDANA